MPNVIRVTQSSIPNLEEYVDEIKSIFGSKWLTNMGEKHQELEKQLMKYLGINYVSLVVNGHMALELSLQAFDFPEGGEVITTPFTFISTTHAVVRNNLTPVFCDIDPDTYCIDANKIEKLVTDKTVAIMPVHVYGNICDVEKIAEIAKKYNLKVIYDAAHAFGEKIKLGDGKERGVATFGDVSCFSFHATKVFNTIEGGAVCSNDETIYKKLYNLKNFGIRDAEYIEAVGANAKMNEFSAAMGLVNLRHLPDEIAKRKNVHERYLKKLSNIDGLKLNYIGSGLTSNYGYFPVLFDEEKLGLNRDEIDGTLQEHDIYARKYFYPLTNDAQVYKGRFSSVSTPIAVKISGQVLALPIYADLALDDVDRICDVILSEINRKGKK